MKENSENFLAHLSVMNKFLLNSELAHHIAVSSKGEKRLDHY